MALVKTQLQDSIACVTLNYPKKLNALSEELIAELMQALDGFQRQKARCVILRANAHKNVWSAGHDVDELPITKRDPLGWSDPLRKVIREIEEFPVPVIGLIEGTVWGGACELALICDMVIATPESTFAVTPAKLGVPYNATGLITFMTAVPMAILKEMTFTAQPVSAERMEKLGIINHVVPAEEIEEFTWAMARQITQNAPLSIAVIKEQLRIFASAHSVTPRMFERVQGLRRVVYDSNDYREGLTAFKEKRKPDFTGT